MRRTLEILACVLLAFATSGAPARVAPMDQPEPVERTVGRIPWTAELVVVIDGLARARHMPATTVLFAILSDLGLTEDVAPSWGALAAKLGWTNSEAMDRLLGSRVVLAAADAQEGAETPWVLLSDISTTTDQRIKERIPIAPRKAVQGLPVFALENGAYEMATVRVPVPGVGGERVLLLLGPSRRATLFDTMAEALVRGSPEALSGTAMVHELAGHASPGVLVAVRIDPSADNAALRRRPWDDFLLCSATPNGDTWECRLAIRDAEVRERVRGVESTSDAPFRAMSRHAMLAVLETRLAEPGAAATSPFERFLSLFTIPAGSADILTGRQALAVWPRDGGAPMSRSKEASSIPAICSAFALETTDVEKMAPVGDRHLGALVKKIERACNSPELPVPDFGGVSCQAVRTVPLELPADAPLRRIFDGPARVAWSYPAAPMKHPQSPRGGWWQVCVTGQGDDDADGCGRGGGACAEASRQMISALLEPPAGGLTDRWVSLGSVRPVLWSPIVRMIADGLGPGFQHADAVVSIFGRIRRVEWRLAARENDDVVGTMQVQMHAAPAAE